MDDLYEDDVRGILKLQIEIVELRDVRCIDPEVVLPSYPRAETFALHGFSTDIERHLAQEPLGQVEVLQRVLPALRVWTLGGTACARQRSLLLQANILSHELLGRGIGVVISRCEPAEKVLGVRARREHAMDDAKIRDGGGIDVEDRDSLGPPERNQVETVEAADDADHVNVVTPVRG